jgi:hypothetical protein
MPALDKAKSLIRMAVILSNAKDLLLQHRQAAADSSLRSE